MAADRVVQVQELRSVAVSPSWRSLDSPIAQEKSAKAPMRGSGPARKVVPSPHGSFLRIRRQTLNMEAVRDRRKDGPTVVPDLTNRMPLV